MRVLLMLLLCCAGVVVAGGDGHEESGARSDELGDWFAVDDVSARSGFERALMGAVLPERLRGWHEMLASEPHRAGSEGDDRVVQRLADAFREMGLEVEVQPIWVYLSDPVSAELEIVSPEKLTLTIKEESLPDDDFSGREGLSFGWNAYSGSGEAVGEVVYANHGRKEDFEQLKALGVDCTGKIVIARYGGNYRGYKAKFAEMAGAAGLIIFTDPKDSGYMRGMVWPEGGYANDTYIQRGSIKTLPYAGDALTPFIEATEEARRLDPTAIPLPKIPVQPIGYGAAWKIMKHMKGESVPNDWQGGLPFRYRLTGGEDLRVRIKVEQDRAIRKTHNVVARITGSERPDQWVVLGSHHDAWGYGASDPAAGTMCLVECARVLAAAAAEGRRPKRSILFGCWAAEEHGIIGSVEWVERHRDALAKGGVAYINMDMAAMGPNFRSSASPVLQRMIADVSRTVPQVGADGTSVFDHWASRQAGAGAMDSPKFGSLGGGSDHVGFWCHLGIPSCSFGAGGSAGTSYHSIYDNLNWYWKTVGEDYLPGRMVTQMAVVAASRLADAPVLPFDPAESGLQTIEHLKKLRELWPDYEPADRAFLRIGYAAEQFATRAAAVRTTLVEGNRSGRIGVDQAVDIDAVLLRMNGRWLITEGIPGRPWFRNLFAATDENSGYASWMLPALRKAVEERDIEMLNQYSRQYILVFEQLGEDLDALETILESDAPSTK
jgi:N-acetylated-alpha-linked acidic dipeptidase